MPNTKKTAKKQSRLWSVYLLQCSDGSYYTGITTDLVRRLHAHKSGKGAKYTRARLPVMLLYHTKAVYSRSEALKRECAIKKLSHIQKEDLIFGR